ncbi:UNVERIFIED_CONTAM: hypothetical protein Sradi_5823300 [Sesamum radiatum]|uniref:Uncharacterized protein n=1 Tax=Sesamum radiatum TaxID=300843 RepID=A0AAW2KPG9_SESRA
MSNIVFTNALERFHSHSSRTIFLHLNDENKLCWLYSLGNRTTTTEYMATSRVGGGLESNSASKSLWTPGTLGSKESDVPKEFHAFKDLICLELFRENVPHNTSALGAGWVNIMTTLH